MYKQLTALIIREATVDENFQKTISNPPSYPVQLGNELSKMKTLHRWTREEYIVALLKFI